MDNSIESLTNIGALKSLFDGMPTKEYGKGDILIHRSDRLHHFFIIKSGYVKVYTIDDSGEEVALLILGPEDMFPLLKNPDEAELVALHYYEAITTATVGTVSRQALLERIKDDRESTWALLSYISNFSSTLTERFSQLEGKRVEQKLENALSYLARVCGEDVDEAIYRLKVKLTHQEIASLVGASRETVSREMKKLERAGSISHEDGYLLVRTTGSKD